MDGSDVRSIWSEYCGSYHDDTTIVTPNRVTFILIRQHTIVVSCFAIMCKLVAMVLLNFVVLLGGSLLSLWDESSYNIIT